MRAYSQRTTISSHVKRVLNPSCARSPHGKKIPEEIVPVRSLREHLGVELKADDGTITVLNDLKAVTGTCQSYEVVWKPLNDPSMIFEHTKRTQPREYRMLLQRLDVEHPPFACLLFHEQRPKCTGDDLESKTNTEHGNRDRLDEQKLSRELRLVSHHRERMSTGENAAVVRMVSLQWNRRPGDGLDVVILEQSMELGEISSPVIDEEHTHGFTKVTPGEQWPLASVRRSGRGDYL